MDQRPFFIGSSTVTKTRKEYELPSREQIDSMDINELRNVVYNLLDDNIKLRESM